MLSRACEGCALLAAAVSRGRLRPTAQRLPEFYPSQGRLAICRYQSMFLARLPADQPMTRSQRASMSGVYRALNSTTKCCQQRVWRQNNRHVPPHGSLFPLSPELRSCEIRSLDQSRCPIVFALSLLPVGPLCCGMA